MTMSLLKSKLLIAAAALLTAVLLITAAAGLSGFVPAKAADEQAAKRTINTSGSGKISASPDIAYISLGVVTEDKNAKTAQQNNAKAMDKIIALIKGAGIASDDIKTTNYSMYPKYNYVKDTGESSIIGYAVNNTVQVTVKDIAKAGNIIDIAASSGANVTNSISFGLSDYEKYYNEALKKAVTAAKNRAQTMAGALGITLKTPVTVTESGGSMPVYNYKSYEMAAADGGVASTPVQAGTIEVTANVSMMYEY